MKRDPKIDIIKGAAICLMVLGHCRCPVSHFIYIFHMAVFFMASGFVYKASYSESFHGLKQLFWKRVKSLWIPCFMFKTFFLLLWNVGVKFHIYDVNYLLTPVQMLHGVVKNVFMLGWVPMCGAFWFLTSLFYITLIYAVVDFIFNKLNIRHKRFFHLALSFIICCSIFLMKKNGIGSDISILNFIMGPYIVYALGVELTHWRIESLSKIQVFCLFLVCFMSLLVCNDGGGVGLDKAEFTSPHFFVVASLSGWFFMLAIAHWLQYLEIVKKILVYLGQNTMCIVGLHFLAFRFVSLFQIWIYDWPVEKLSSSRVLETSSGWWIVYFCTSIGFCLLFNLIYKLLKRKFQKC